MHTHRQRKNNFFHLENIGYAAVTTGLISTLAPGIGILGVTSILYPTIGTTAYLYGKKNIKFCPRVS